MVTRADKYTTRSQSPIYFADFSNQFKRNSASGMLERLTNSDSIKQALKNLILTNRGERFFQPHIGGDVNRHLFENIDNFTADDLQEQIVLTIRNNEQRVDELQVDVKAVPEQNAFKVEIFFTVINDNTLNNFNLTLQRVR